MNHLAAQSSLLADDPAERFFTFHRDNPRVFKLFELYTMQAINSGRKRYGARAIVERVRWEVNITTTGSEFKIDNCHIPYYARLFAQVHPEHKDFFEFRNRN